ncbi:NAD(P)/FAD-dependent oxidoreductase [Plantactinospora veratri]|uniref:NAD(P)/FAD-dependent oxidoreductase n=1 Tax=Plantactinospora veratri TaxID=1436122 RepID=A0ABU7SDH2_9ACTN
MPARGYDVIVVGSRVAGAATAMLLGRRGLRVLAVDRARFPSDTLSTHQVQVPGVARLHRWGLLERLAAAGTPASREIRLDTGDVVLAGRYPGYQGVDALYSPRRTLLDALLVDAAREAGVEVREGFDVDELVRDRDRVVGVRGRQRGGTPVTETAALVIGADGKRSMVAARVRAAAYRERPASTFACYTYWSGVALAGGEFYQRPGRTVAVFPTNDGLTIAYVAGRATDFPAFRADVESHYLATLDDCGDLGARVRAGERAERFRLTPDVPNAFRVPHGPGWALVGDAGLVMDPITGQGIGNAFRDVELLVEAVAAGLDSGDRLDAELAGYRARRDAAALPMYDLTLDLASFRPPRAVDRELFVALSERPAAVDQFLGVLSGAVPMSRFRSPRNLLTLLGPRALVRIAAADLLRR